MLVEKTDIVGTSWAPEPPGVTNLTLEQPDRIVMHGWVAGLIILDMVGTLFLCATIFLCYAGPLGYAETQLWPVLCGFVITWTLASHSQGLYDRETMLAGRRVLLTKALASWSVAFGLIMLAAFGLRFIGGISRLWLMASAFSSLFWVTSIRLLLRECLRARLRNGYCLERALILCGSMSAGYRARAAIEGDGEIRVSAVRPLPGTAGAPSLASIEAAIRSGLIDRVFIAGFDKHVVQTNSLLDRLAQFAIDLTILPNFEGLDAPPIRLSRVGMLPAVDVACRPLSPVQALMKRGEDLLLGALFLLLAAPTMLIIALMIKIDSRGPVFFRQTRLGFHDKEFKVWKFRTMERETRAGGELRQTCRDDKRVTRVGKILRRTSLDELPQLFNVLAGEMSIVGPRPHARSMTTAGLPLHSVMDDYASRHRIKPGITGWAQINGCRGEVNTEAKLRQRVMFDCHYIENWSLALDAWIILRTVTLVLFDKDAY